MNLAIGLDEVLGTVLVMVRLFFVFVVAPVFGHTSVPMRVRVAVAFAVSLAFGPRYGTELPAESSIALAAATEAVIGLAIGIIATVVFAGIGLAGELMSIQGGLGAAAVLDPSSGASSVVLTGMVQLFALLYYLAGGGHHELIRAVALSFEALPLGGGGPPAESFGQVVSFGGVMFEVAVRLAAPITAAMLLANVSVGILGRTIPQLNLMALQLPGHVGVSLLLMGVGSHLFGDELQRVFADGTRMVTLLLPEAG